MVRLYLIVEAFVSMRALPLAAYKTVTWSDILPHARELHCVEEARQLLLEVSVEVQGGRRDEIEKAKRTESTYQVIPVWNLCTIYCVLPFSAEL